MNKIFYAFLLSVFTVTICSAQNTSIGLRAGLTAFNFTGDDAGDTKTLLGFNGGAFGTYSVNRNWGITLEVNYMAKGSQPENSNLITNTRVAYLEVPLYINYFFEGDRLRPKLFAGGTYGSLMTAKQNRLKQSKESCPLRGTTK